MVKILLKELEWFEEATDITDTDYIGELTEDRYIDENTLIEMISELIKCYRRLESKYEQLEQNLKDNYRPIDDYVFYGIDENIFH